MPCRVLHVASLSVDLEPLTTEQVVSGDPATGSVAFDANDTWEAGVWEHTVGVSTDVEADEVFVVISGRATIAVDDGPTLDIGPGDVGVLEAGARTTWTVHETLRKVYITPARPSEHPT